MKETCPPCIFGKLRGGEKRPLAALQHLPNQEVAPQTFPPPTTSLAGTNSSASTLASMDLHVSHPFHCLNTPPPSYHHSFPILSVSCCKASLLHRDLCCTLPLAEAEDASPPVYPDLLDAIPSTPFRLTSTLNAMYVGHTSTSLRLMLHSTHCFHPHPQNQNPISTISNLSYTLPNSFREAIAKSAGSLDSQQILNSVCWVASHATRATDTNTFHPQHGPYLRTVGHLTLSARACNDCALRKHLLCAN